VQFHIERVEKHIADYLDQLDALDEAEGELVDDQPIQEKLNWLKKDSRN
jgi:hypothetical protein